jgi:hypothetical protein
MCFETKAAAMSDTPEPPNSALPDDWLNTVTDARWKAAYAEGICSRLLLTGDVPTDKNLETIQSCIQMLIQTLALTLGDDEARDKFVAGKVKRPTKDTHRS